MKVLFLVYHALVDYSGISKKILAQVEGLRNNGHKVSLCNLQFTADGTQQRVCNGIVLRSFGNGLRAKITKRVSYSDIVEYAIIWGIEMVYIRYDINADPFTVRLMRRLKRNGLKIAVEIPTWPYDGEFKGQSRKLRFQHFIDSLFRHSFFKYVDKVVTYASCDSIFDRPTIRISNGIDFDKVPLVTGSEAGQGLRLLSVANIHLWHGLDRLIAGMAANPDVQAELHIVGDGLPEIIESYRNMAIQAGIGDRVKILGPMYGEDLNREFEWANLAVGSLGRHRSGINDIKTLKNREYAARGLAFFYSENDSDFDEAPYVMKVPADESPVDIAALKSFRDGLHIPPKEIRHTVSGLSWTNQMRKVIEGMNDRTAISS